jgi:hypothetical protein
MRICLVTLLFFFAFLATACVDRASTTSPEPAARPKADRGNEIVDEYVRRSASPYRKDAVRLTVRGGSEPEVVYELDVYRRQNESGTTTLSIIKKPAENAGTASLSIEVPDEPTVNVTYSAARGDFRETGTEKMYFGGLTIQELLGEWSKYDHTFKGERTEGQDTRWEVAGKLKDGKRSLIETTTLFFDSETNLPVATELFDRSGKKLRTYKAGRIASTGGKPYVSVMNVENHIYNTQITIEVLSRAYPETLDDSLFTRERLKRSAAE